MEIESSGHRMVEMAASVLNYHQDSNVALHSKYYFHGPGNHRFTASGPLKWPQGLTDYLGKTEQPCSEEACGPIAWHDWRHKPRKHFTMSLGDRSKLLLRPIPAVNGVRQTSYAAKANLPRDDPADQRTKQTYMHDA